MCASKGSKLGCSTRDWLQQTRPHHTVSQSLHWLPVRQSIDFKISLLIFNCLNGTAPSYLTSLFTRYEPPSSFRHLSFRPELVLPRIKSKKYGSTSFSYAGPAIWNSLPIFREICFNVSTVPLLPESSSLSCCFGKLKFICFLFPKSLPCLFPYYL